MATFSIWEVAINLQLMALEVILSHNADAVGIALGATHVVTTTIEILQSYGEVRGYVAEGVTEDILASLVLVA